MIERLSNWEELLNVFLASVHGKPLTPGEHDGAMFAASAVEAMTGEDFGKDFRKQYTTCEHGLELVGDLAGYLEDRLPRVPKSHAQRGDVIMLNDGNLAICFGGIALAVGEHPENGLERVERERWRKAWRIG